VDIAEYKVFLSLKPFTFRLKSLIVIGTSRELHGPAIDVMTFTAARGNMDQEQIWVTSRTSLELLQEKWRTRLLEARTRYYECLQGLRNVEAEVNCGVHSAPDGSLALRNARIRESTAQEEYIRVSLAFTELVLHGRMPEGEDG
jgi:hypothetical protein